MKRVALRLLFEKAGTGLAAFAIVLSLVLFSPAYAEIKTVVAQGKTDVCFARETALDLARTGASNEAHDECWALGKGWSFSGVKFPGYSQCFRCGKSEEFRCAVTQAVFNCVNMDKENAEKAAKKRAEEEKLRADKELAVKLAKEKEDRERAALLQKKKDDADREAKARAQKALETKQLKEKAEAARIEQLRKQKETEDIAAKARAEKLLAAKQVGKETEVERAKLVAKRKESDDKLTKAPPVKNSPPIKAAAGSTTEKTAEEGGNPIEDAFAKGALCEKPGADKKYSFCPEQKAKKEVEAETKKSPQEYTSNIWDELDDKGAEPEIQKRLKELRDAYRGKATHQCDTELKKINTCYTTSNCQPKSENEIQGCLAEQCGNRPTKDITVRSWYESTGESTCKGTCIVFPNRFEYKPNPKYAPWQSCTQNASQCRVDQSCIDKCNPHNYSTVDQCVEKSMQNGPTADDAKKLVREGWKKKAVQPKSSSTQPTNFLD
jgi:hypothetical protein